MLRFTAKLMGLSHKFPRHWYATAASPLAPIVEELGGIQPELLPGYRIKVIDGNSLAASEHRLEVLRTVEGGPLPGKSLVVLDPVLMLAIDQFPCEDAYTQERALLPKVLQTIEARDVWIGDRNLCKEWIFSWCCA